MTTKLTAPTITHHPGPPSSSQVQLSSFLPECSACSLPQAVQGDEEEGLWSDHNTLSLRFLAPDPFPLLQCGSSPRGRVLQEKTALVWVQQLLPGNLLLSGLLSTGRSSCQAPAPAWDLQGLQVPSGHLHLLQHWAGPGLQGGYLLQQACLWAAQRQPASPQYSPCAAHNCLLPPGSFVRISWLSSSCNKGCGQPSTGMKVRRYGQCRGAQNMPTRLQSTCGVDPYVSDGQDSS